MRTHDRSIVITGATGFLGREIVHRLLDRDANTRLTLLVRGKDDADASRRGDEVLAAQRSGDALADARRRVRVLRADLEHDRFGLDAAGYDALVADTGAVIHGAATVSFTEPLDQARRINVEGTRRMLDLAAAAGARTDYIGTTYIAGDRSGVAYERDLDVGQPFHNTYEQTKMEAEKLVQSRWSDQPVAVFRPSIIVGDSRTGRTSSFKVLYWPLKMFSRGMWWIVPGRLETRVDIVPSDYVVDALLHIRRDEASLGRVHHLAAGPEKSARVGELVDLAATFFNVRKPTFVNPKLFVRYARPVIDRFAVGRWRHALLTGRVYTPYLSLDLVFDTQNARTALRGSGIDVPPVTAYFDSLFRYCIETDWGRKPVEPEPAAVG